MAKIYELKIEQQDLLDKLFWIPEGDEEEVSIQRELDKIQGTIERKLEFLSGVLLEATAIKNAKVDAVRKMQIGIKTAENAENRLKAFILETMSDFEIKKVFGSMCNVTLCAGRESLNYAEDFDPVLLPSDCYNIDIITEINPIADVIKEHINNGEEIPGVSIIKKPYLLVK